MGEEAGGGVYEGGVEMGCGCCWRDSGGEVDRRGSVLGAESKSGGRGGKCTKRDRGHFCVHMDGIWDGWELRSLPASSTPSLVQ